MPVTEGYGVQNSSCGKRATPDAACFGPADCRNHRSDFCARFHSGDLRHHQDPFIVYTSNVFAILGLRSLYFLLAGVIDKFHYLKIGLAIILGFVGVKMVAEVTSGYFMEHAIHVPIQWSLMLIAAVLAVSVVVSLLFPNRNRHWQRPSNLPPNRFSLHRKRCDKRRGREAHVDVRPSTHE